MAKILVHKQTQHGFHGSRVYKVWGDMVKRCENKNSSSYKYYGGRGIKVCDQWRLNPKEFCEWAISNGYEKGLTIDRKNRNGNYCPDNCHFITHAENCGAGKRVNNKNKTGHTGICMTKHGTYEVYVTINRSQKYCGVRKTIEEALILRDANSLDYSKHAINNTHENTKQ